ncbi:MAG: sulfatase [Chloroflexota bacterium]
MKAIMIMFDSLNRRMLPPYGCDWTHAPNFQRLAEHTVTFDNAYVGSMPCMPARRELHTGRYNFLHRSWGPMEPFDDSMPDMLRNNDIYTHLITDHMHYYEEGSGNYHTKYVSWEYLRGQQGDPWLGVLKDPEVPELLVKLPESAPRSLKTIRRQDWVNRAHMQAEEDHPQAKTFARGVEFLHTNHDEDNWFLHIETFDPHEPFFSNQTYKDLYPHDYDGPHIDWPPYRRVQESPDIVQHVRYEYAALLSMCDAYLGKVLDVMDEYNLWEDTMLIVNTDHGFLLGEHDWWAKSVQPFYNEVAHVPFFVWDPRTQQRNVHNDALVQTIDIAPTLLDFFGLEIPADMEGVPLHDSIANNSPTREAALFGIHGGHVNVTDGRYVYMRAPATPENGPLYEYTLMPAHMRFAFSVEELQETVITKPFTFMKNCPVMKMKARSGSARNMHQFGTLLFDLETDPHQEQPINDPAAEAKMIAHLVRLMKANDTPMEQFERLGLISD